jgi:saccharopine dehydrogenase-like NADP-dependent oxidoreductase
MWEKTLRYPGHADKIKLLKDLGFFSESPIDGIVPKEVTAKILEKVLRRSDIPDLLLMKVKVCGLRNEIETCYVFYLIEHYDKLQKITAMAKTTAYTASVIAQLMIKGHIRGKGVIPPEKLGMNEILYREIITSLQKHGIMIHEET